MSQLPLDVTELRLGLLDGGYLPLPITSPDAPGKDAGKKPTLPQWHTVEITRDAIRDWGSTRRRETNTGLRCGRLLGLDLDVLDAALVSTLLDLVNNTIGATPLHRVGRTPKILLPFRAEQPFTKIKSHRLLMPDGQHALVEGLAAGQQFVAFGIHPATRQPYQWGRHTPLDVPLADLPAVTELQVRAFVAEAESLLRAAGGHTAEKDNPASTAPRSREPRPASAWPAPTRQDVHDALKAVSNNVDWHGWVKVGAALFDALADDGEDLFIQWSAQSSKDDPEYTRRKWRSFHSSPMNTTASTLFWMARQNGWRPTLENSDQPGARRKEIASLAFRLLRAGIPSAELLDRLHLQNSQRPNPLPSHFIDATALWAATQLKDGGHAQR